MGHSSAETNRGQFKLVPRINTSRISSRDYYQRYLRHVVDDPELEAKQHLQFVSVQQ
jgi:hypothetical protein